jgi:hypothetical protein
VVVEGEGEPRDGRHPARKGRVPSSQTSSEGPTVGTTRGQSSLAAKQLASHRPGNSVQIHPLTERPALAGLCSWLLGGVGSRSATDAVVRLVPGKGAALKTLAHRSPIPVELDVRSRSVFGNP